MNEEIKNDELPVVKETQEIDVYGEPENDGVGLVGKVAVGAIAVGLIGGLVYKIKNRKKKDCVDDINEEGSGKQSVLNKQMIKILENQGYTVYEPVDDDEEVVEDFEGKVETEEEKETKK